MAEDDVAATLAKPELDRGIVPQGAFSFPISVANRPRRLGFVLLPDFTLLAFSAALEPLRVANQLAQKQLYHWTTYSEDGDPVTSSSGVCINVDAILAAPSKDQRLIICSGNHGMAAANEQTLSILRKHSRFGGPVGGVCTGATTLARAGLLDGRKFTLHWENQPGFEERFPALQPTKSRFEIDDDLWTCGGGAAGAEMMLSIIRQDYGRDFAIVVADMLLLNSDFQVRSSQRYSISAALSTRNPKLIQIFQAMHENIEEPLSLDELCNSVGLSRRHMERYFERFVGESPMKAYRNIRLDRARVLVIETDMDFVEIGAACGFRTTAVFTRHYKARFGVTPFAQAESMRQKPPL